MKVAVTGGAGYIGAHVANAFINAGHDVLIMDDLSRSNSRRVNSLRAEFVKISINKSDEIYDVIKGADLIIHCAALKSVEESENNPSIYENVNIAGTENLLVQMVKAKISKLIFASTAAVYGNSVKSPISENSIPVPISTYGRTKLEAEGIISNFVRTYGLSAVSLRFFNAVGAATNDLVDTSRDNLFPRVFDAISKGESPQIFGDDYPTPDGTCIRDYIHVQDIADAHIAVAEYLKHKSGHNVFNVGTGKGYSVKEIISGIQEVAGTKFESAVKDRRHGDLDVAYADPSLLFNETGWKAKYDLNEMIRSSWAAWQADK